MRAFVVFSILLPVLPLLTFYSIYYGFFDGLLGYWNVAPLTDNAKGLISALAAVGVVNLVAGGFVLVAYTEKAPLLRTKQD